MCAGVTVRAHLQQQRLEAREARAHAQVNLLHSVCVSECVCLGGVIMAPFKCCWYSHHCVLLPTFGRTNRCAHLARVDGGRVQLVGLHQVGHSTVEVPGADNVVCVVCVLFVCLGGGRACPQPGALPLQAMWQGCNPAAAASEPRPAETAARSAAGTHRAMSALKRARRTFRRGLAAQHTFKTCGAGVACVLSPRFPNTDLTSFRARAMKRRSARPPAACRVDV